MHHYRSLVWLYRLRMTGLNVATTMKTHRVCCVMGCQNVQKALWAKRAPPAGTDPFGHEGWPFHTFLSPSSLSLSLYIYIYTYYVYVAHWVRMSPEASSWHSLCKSPGAASPVNCGSKAESETGWAGGPQPSANRLPKILLEAINRRSKYMRDTRPVGISWLLREHRMQPPLWVYHTQGLICLNNELKKAHYIGLTFPICRGLDEVIE